MSHLQCRKAHKANEQPTVPHALHSKGKSKGVQDEVSEVHDRDRGTRPPRVTVAHSKDNSRTASASQSPLCPAQPALVAEVLHDPEMDKIKEVYDSIRPVRSVVVLGWVLYMMHSAPQKPAPCACSALVAEARTLSNGAPCPKS